MLDNLNAQEEAMTQMFSGTRDKEEKTFTVRLTPDREFNNEVAFRFSKKLGVVANNDLAGTPFYISLKDLKSVKIPQEDGKKKKDLDGIAYNEWCWAVDKARWCGLSASVCRWHVHGVDGKPLALR